MSSPVQPSIGSSPTPQDHSLPVQSALPAAVAVLGAPHPAPTLASPRSIKPISPKAASSSIVSRVEVASPLETAHLIDALRSPRLNGTPAAPDSKKEELESPRKSGASRKKGRKGPSTFDLPPSRLVQPKAPKYLAKMAGCDPIYREMMEDFERLRAQHGKSKAILGTIPGIAAIETNLEAITKRMEQKELFKDVVFSYGQLKAHDDQYTLEKNGPVHFEKFASSFSTTARALKETYLLEKKRGELVRFFSCAFDSTGCLEERSEEILEYAGKIDTPLGFLTYELQMAAKRPGFSRPVMLEKFLAYLSEKDPATLKQLGIDLSALADRNHPLTKELEKRQLIARATNSVVDIIGDELGVFLMDNQSPTMDLFKEHLRQSSQLSLDEKIRIRQYLNAYFEEHPEQRSYLKSDQR